jgi:hypothetical protein
LKKLLVIILITYFIVTCLLIKDNSASDGLLEIGFPYLMYKSTEGKVVNAAGLGIQGKSILFNVLFLVGVMLVVYFLTKRVRQKNEALLLREDC